MSEKFQVDLAGMVDLLSRHLYSGPQVYIRELLQNSVDALAARRGLDPDSPARVRIRADDDSLSITDTGIGLSAAEARDLLATIGRSSKRSDGFDLERQSFIGQFGIGLLASFMVAEEIVVTSRSAHRGARPIRWVGRASGTFDISETDEDIEVGTTVHLVAREDATNWVSHDIVTHLVSDYGSLLPVDIAIATDVGGEQVWRRLTRPALPWSDPAPGQPGRGQALSKYCEDTFGFSPLGHIDLDVPVAGLSGVAFILPQAVSPSSGRHRVYLKNMLLGARVDQILPEWAFFVRAVLNTDVLSPTASREQLHEDEMLLAVRDAIGSQLKGWATTTLSQPSDLAENVIRTHHLALRALATTDPTMLDLITEILPFETTMGPATLAQISAHHGDGEILYTTTPEDYRRVAPVARAQGLTIVNAGYVYDADLLSSLTQRGWHARELSSTDVVHTLAVPDLERELDTAAAIARCKQILGEEGADIILRSFPPETVPAIVLHDSAGEHQRALQQEADASPDLWGGLLESFAEPAQAHPRTLVLNDSCPLVRRLLAVPEGEIFTASLRTMYYSAVMLAGEGLRGEESMSLTDSLGALLEASLGVEDGEDA